MSEVILENNLNNFSDAERDITFSILKELKEKGTSDIYKDLLYADYREIPVDIETFVDDNNYLGYAWHDAQGNSKLYPYWRKILRELFPDNITTKVNNALLSGSRGRGKAQPLDALVLSKNGYVTMGSIKVGDQVYGRDGKLHNVIGVFPQGKKDIWKMSFSDGTSTECSGEHLWTVYDNRLGRSKSKKITLTTNELRKIKYKSIGKEGWVDRYIELPMCDPIEFDHKDTFISPYMMGCLLGDGCFGENQCVDITTNDKEIYNTLLEEIDSHGYTFHLGAELCYNIVKKERNHNKNLYAEEISTYKLRDKHSWDKFIPHDYLYNDVDSRINLLQGLIDTDGEVEQAGNVKFATTSEQLCKDVVWLVQSLGGTVLVTHSTNKTYHYTYNFKDKNIDEIRPCRDCWELAIKLPGNIQPCRLQRKLSRLKKREDWTRHSRRLDNIEYIGDKECQCILIDSDEHLYLTNDFIVTHNTEVAILVACYLMYRVMCLKDPIDFFNLKPTEQIVFAFMNIKLSLAEEIGNTKFQNTVKSSPWFMQHGTLEGKTIKYWVPEKIKGREVIRLVIGSQASDVIGQPIYFAFFDEIDFIRNQDIDKQKEKAKDMIDTAIGGMKTRFIHKGKNPTILILASSKRSDKSFLEEHMRMKLKSEKENVLISDGSVWEVKPDAYSKETFNVALGNKFLNSQVIPDGDDVEVWKAKGYKIINPPIDFKSNFLEDIDKALCDFAGIASTELSKYISGEMVYSCIKEERKNPFNNDILEIGNSPDDTAQYYNYFDISKIPRDLLNRPLCVHLDMSISGDMTGIAGTFIKGKKPTIDGTPSRDLYYSLGFSVSIKAPKGRQISFEKNRNFIRWLRDQGLNIKEVTADTFQSYDLIQQLQAEGFNCSLLSVDRVDSDRICKPYQSFKNALYETRFELYNSKRLVDEITDLERNINNGKVDHPPNGHKDVVDAVCGSMFTCSKYAEEFAYDYGESVDTIIEAGSSVMEEDKEQIIVDFEEELKKMSMSKIPGSVQQDTSYLDEYDGFLIL